MITPLKLVARNEHIPERFETLKPGTVFRHASDWYLRLDAGGSQYDVVNLMTFKLHGFGADAEVFPYENPHLHLNFE